MEWIVIFVIEVFSANPTAFQLVKCFKCIYVLILLSYLLFFFFLINLRKQIMKLS